MQELERMCMFLEAPKSNLENPTEKDAGVKADDKRIQDRKNRPEGKKDDEDLDKKEKTKPEDDPTEKDDDESDTDEHPDEEEDPPENDNEPPGDNIKKYRLFTQFETLYEKTQELKGNVDSMDITDLSTRERQTYSRIIKILEENIDKLDYILKTSYDTIEYNKLLHLYLYIQTSVVTVADIVTTLN